MTGLDKPVAGFLGIHERVHNFIYRREAYLPGYGLPVFKPTAGSAVGYCRAGNAVQLI